MNLFDLTGKRVLVTGAGGLLGQVMTRALAEAGAVVLAADIATQALSPLVEELGRDRVLPWQLDITSEESVRAILDGANDQLGGLDCLVNNAYPRNKNYGRKFEAIALPDWKDNIDTHLGGYFLISQQAAELFKGQGHGNIVFMGSIYGLAGPDFSIYRDTPMTMPAEYAAIKGALVMLTKYMSSYYGTHGVRVNCLSPGGVFDNQPETFVAAYEAKTPLGRMARPEDIVGALLFLVSDASAYVSGHNLVVDGGITATI